MYSRTDCGKQEYAIPNRESGVKRRSEAYNKTLRSIKIAFHVISTKRAFTMRTMRVRFDGAREIVQFYVVRLPRACAHVRIYYFYRDSNK